MEDMKEYKEQGFTVYLKELWDSFEKSGSVSAYLLYSEAKKNAEKDDKELGAKK